MKKVLIAIGVILFLGSIFISPYVIKVKPVCKNQFGTCSTQILSEVNKFSGKSLNSAKNGIDKLLKSALNVSSHSIQFKIPNTLEVNIIEKVPEYCLFSTTDNKYVLVDFDGTVISLSDSQSALPLVKTADSIKNPGEKVKESELFALKIVSGVNQMYQITTGDIQSDTLLVDLKPNIRVIFPLEGDIDVLLGALRLIYTKIVSTELAGKYSQIDLRFKNPVLR